MADQIIVSVKVDAKPGEEAFKRVRRQANRTAREAVQIAATKVILPDAKRRIGGGKTAATLVVRKGRVAYLTTTLRGKKGRYVGLLEFGGTVRTRLVPKRAKALLINGRFAANVTAPRTYKAKLFLTNAVHDNLPAIEEQTRSEIMVLFAKENFEVD